MQKATNDLTLSLDELAAMLGRSPAWLKNHLAELAHEGLPRRLPGGRFYRPAVTSWMAQASGMTTAAELIQPQSQRSYLELVYSEGRGK